MPTRLCTVAVLAGLAVLALPTAAGQSVRGEALRLDSAKRGAAPAFRSSTPAPQATLRFQVLDAARVSALRRHNVANGGKRLQIGIERHVADEAAAPLPDVLAWTAVPGGHVLRIDVTSPDAAALRVGLDLRGPPDGTELRVASANGGVVEFVDTAAMASGVDGDGTYWTPVTDGETQRIELYVPGPPPAFRPTVLASSHLLTSPLRRLNLAKALGDSGACNIDVACRSALLGQAYVNTKNAVARLVFQDGGPFSCTGTLLNDSAPASQIPYLFSAAHCFDTQAVANTLITVWNDESPACGVDHAAPYIPLAGGADLLHADTGLDVRLVRLRRPPPAGAYVSGWNATTLSPATPILTIHHPSSDTKKVSRGSHSGFSSDVTFSNLPRPVRSAARASWAEGTTEGDSSGAGLFTLEGTDYQLRGGLVGGNASCANSGRSEAAGTVDSYSRLDQAYPSLQPWLGATAGPTRDYTGAWYVPSEPGWGLTVFNYPGQVFALFFVYDIAGRPAWYRLQGAWTGTDQVTANLDRPNGPAWSSNFNADAVGYTVVGNATLVFTSAASATLRFNDGTVDRTVPLAKL